MYLAASRTHLDCERGEVRVSEPLRNHPQDGVDRESLPLPHEARPVDTGRRAVQRLRPVDRGAQGGPAFPDKLQDPAETKTKRKQKVDARALV